MGEFDKAIELYDQALEITPRHAYVIHDRGMAYFGKKDYEKAISDMTEAMEMSKDEKGFIAQCHNDRGVVYFQTGDFEKSWADA